MKTNLLLAAILLCFHFSQGQSPQVLGKGNIKNIQVTASSNAAKGINTLNSVGFLPNDKAASRFLSQATMGPVFSEINTLKIQGIESWLNRQLNMPVDFSLNSYVSGLHNYVFDSLRAINPTEYQDLSDVFISDLAFDIAWFQGNMISANRLRWRVSMALSQIFVTSRISAFDNNPYALASYYEMLHRNAFGNYRSLIDSITYHPAMAVYLTYMNNHATDTLAISASNPTKKQIFPDENYAREIMQLFSIGLFELNNNGTEKRDAQNRPIATYDNDDIANLAKVFTGLSWAHSQYLGDNRNVNNWSYTRRLKFFPIDSSDRFIRHWANPSTWRIVNGHEPGTKTFLGQTIPSRPVQQGEQDIQDALNIIFNHSNVGPFISRRLIQHLVTSNPSPEFINRISNVFSNNGNGVRGDLKAVIRAILLDPEARDCCAENSDKTYGHLREPILRYMNIVKGLNLRNQNGIYRNVMNNLYDRIEQKALYSPSVFNFYQPGYVPDGPLQQAGKVAPEFQMLNSLSFANYMNAVHTWVINNDPIEYWGLFSNETFKTDQDPRFDLTSDYYLAKTNRLKEFLDKYNLILAQGRVTPENMAIIENVLKTMPMTYDVAGNPNVDLADRRLRMGIFLILITPDYLINR